MFCVDFVCSVLDVPVCVCVSMFVNEWQNVISFWLKFTTISFVVSLFSYCSVLLDAFFHVFRFVSCVYVFCCFYIVHVNFAFDFHCLFYHLWWLYNSCLRYFEWNVNVNSHNVIRIEKKGRKKEGERERDWKFLGVRIRLKQYWANIPNPSITSWTHINIYIHIRHIWKGDKDVLCQWMNERARQIKKFILWPQWIVEDRYIKKETERKRKKIEIRWIVCPLYDILGVGSDCCGWSFDSKIKMTFHFI